MEGGGEGEEGVLVGAGCGAGASRSRAARVWASRPSRPSAVGLVLQSQPIVVEGGLWFVMVVSAEVEPVEAF